MFGLFGKKNKEDKKSTSEEVEDVDVSHLSDAKQQLFAQLKAKRTELGEEEIAKIQKTLEMDKMKKQIKSDIENDEDKRNRLLDEIRFGMKQDR